MVPRVAGSKLQDATCKASIPHRVEETRKRRDTLRPYLHFFIPLYFELYVGNALAKQAAALLSHSQTNFAHLSFLLSQVTVFFEQVNL